jgi:TolB-like protein/tetratricopeptide (TPR) repeat protein
MGQPSLFTDLRKRKVVQVAAIYGAVAWGVTEGVVTISEQLFLPQWISTLAVIGFVVGFPVAMFLAWTFDLTAEGIRPTGVSSRRGTASIVLSLLLLVAGTAGLFLLINPALQQREQGDSVAILPDSLAVLPFDNAGRNPDDAYLSEGLSDALRDQMGQVSGLRIAARSSSIAVGELGGDAKSKAHELGVAYLVEGSLRRTRNLLRVSVELVDGSNGLAIWSERFERGPAELISLQQEIMEQVVRRLMPGSADTLPMPATGNPTANEAMLLGRYYEEQDRASEEVATELLLKAAEYYREAAELDPESALAQSRLARVLLNLGDIDAAQAPIFEALRLGPNLSEVQHTLGLYYFSRGDPKAYDAFELAVVLDPDNADALESYGFVLWVQGIDENVPELYREALEIDRQILGRYGALGQILGKQGEVEEVRELIRRIQQRFDGVDAHRLISRLLELIGAVDEAIVWGIRARDLDPGNEDHNEWLAELYTDIGDFRTARQLDPTPGIGLLLKMRRYDELIPIAEDLMIEEPGNVPVRYVLAFAHNATGEYERALWVLKDTGLPRSTMTFPRSGLDWEGFFTLLNASFGFGDKEATEGLAKWYVYEAPHHDSPDWFTECLVGCALSLLENDDGALDVLELMQRSPRLVPEYLLEDLVCLRRFAGVDRFEAIVDHFSARRAEIRERLPKTLADAGVTLD